MVSGKSPVDALGGQTLLHWKIVQDIVVIVVGQEVVVAHIMESKERDHDQHDAHRGDLPRLVGACSSLRGVCGL
jgi:hypothetical protein